MSPDQQIIYNTLTAVLEELKTVKEELQDTRGLTKYEGMKIQDLSDVMKVSVSHIRKHPWYLPFDEPFYGKNPVVYSRAQIIDHLKLIDDKGLDEVKRMWQNRQKSKWVQ